ncbi:Replication protein A 70 kDa DNA-binding subunit B, partial [Bienertia sinuspersici]
MKPLHTPLAKLTPNTKACKVKVKVIQKAQPKQSPGKKRVQRLLFKDDEGTIIKGAIFQDDIQSFEKALQRNGEYEITGVTVQAVPPQFRRKPNELQLNFNEKVKITPISIDKCSDEPQYIKLASVPCIEIDDDELLDVLGVVIFISGIRDVKYGQIDNQVRDISIKDESSPRPLILSAWNEFARVECETLNKWSQPFIVVGFLGVRRLIHKGITLGTTMSTSFVMDPTGERADELRRWATQHAALLSNRRSKLLELHFPPSTRTITTVAEIENKKTDSTWQEEKFWLDMTIPNATIDDLYCYFGCNQCGRRTKVDEDNISRCTTCKGPDVSSIPSATFKFYGADSTRAYKLTIFSQDVETLFTMNCADLHRPKSD